MSYEPLSYSKHGSLHLTRGTFFVFENQPCVPVSSVEAPRAALDLPLAFARTRRGLSLMAILSLDSKDNAHIGPKGLWMGGYMPAVVRAHPFAVAYRGEKAAVLVDTQSDWLSENAGNPLFDAEGNPNTVLQNKIDLLRNQAPNPNRDNPVLQAIGASGVLKPWPATFEGLHQVDPRALGGLGAEDFLHLRDNNALPVLYAQLMSMPRINRVKNLARRKQKMSEKKRIDWKLSDDDILSFGDDLMDFDDE
ncbi:MAG: SapC family protein [Thermodesulfobacteriota bacterium]